MSVVNPLKAGSVAKSAKEQGATAIKAAGEKHRKYDSYINNVSFIPFIMETYGGLGIEAIGFIKRLATQVARHRGTSYRDEKRHLFQKLSLTLQRGVAIMLTSRMHGPT